MAINNCTIFDLETEALLYKYKIVNGIGGEGANLDALFKTIIKEAGNYVDTTKLGKLYNDIARLSVPHDIGFLICSSKLEFYFYNYIFVRDLGKLLKWLPWYKRKSIQLIIFIILNRYGKQYSRHFSLQKASK